MFLYDLPLIPSSMSIKTVGGIFTHTKTQTSDSKNDKIIERLSHQIISAKTNVFELYQLITDQQKKIKLKFICSTPVFGVIVNIQTITVMLPTQSTNSKQSIDLIIVTFMSGQMSVYNYQPEKNQFFQIFREIIFDKEKNIENIISHHPKYIGNYITASDMNHFLIGSIKQVKKLYIIQTKSVDKKYKLKVKGINPYFLDKDSICWGMAYLPCLSSESQIIGKYIAIQKKMAVLQQQNVMINQEEQSKRIKIYTISKTFNMEISQEGSAIPQSAHLLIPISALTCMVFCQNKLIIKQLLDPKKIKQQKKQEDFVMKFPIRQNLSASNIKVMFSCYCKRYLSNQNENLIYVINQFGDMFKIQCHIQNNLIYSFNIKYINTLSTANSLVYLERIFQKRFINSKAQSVQTKHQDGDLLLIGFERFSTSIYLLQALKNNDSKPNQTKVSLRGYGKAKTNKNYPQIIPENTLFKPITERSKDCQKIFQINQFGVIMDIKIADLRSASNNDKEKIKQGHFEIYALTNSGNLRHQQQIQQTQIDANGSQICKSYLKIIKKGLKVKQINSISFAKPTAIFCLKKFQKDTFHRIICICQSNKTSVLLQTGTNLSITRDYNFDENYTTQYVGKLEDDSTIQVSTTKMRHIKKQKIAKDYVLKNKLLKATSCGGFVATSVLGGQIIIYQLDKFDNLSIMKEIQVKDQAIYLEFTPLQKIEGEHTKRSHFIIIGMKNYEFHIYSIEKINKTDITINFVNNFNCKSSIQSISAIFSYFKEDEAKYFIFAGLQDGRMIKYDLDRNMKKLKQKHFRVGNKAVKLIKMFGQFDKKVSVLCLSTKTYIYYFYRNKEYFSLIDYPLIQAASELKQPQFQNTIMVYSEGNLKNISIETFGEQFHQDKVDLFYSGKKMIVFENNIGIIDGGSSFKSKPQNKQDLQMLEEQNMIREEILQRVWQSQFTIYRPKENKKVAAIYFDKNNQVCLSACYSKVEGTSMKGNYLVFGCAKGLSYTPQTQLQEYSIKVYAWFDLQIKFQYLYKVDIDGVPLVIEPFFKSDKIIVGVSNSLKLFQFGKKKLLKKAQLKNLTSNVNQIKVVGQKIYVTQVCNSFHLYKYVPQQLTFYAVSDDIFPRYTTAMNILDSQTLCGADKFGNIFISRISQNAKNQFQNFSLNSFKNSQNYLQTCQYKFNLLAKTNIGQIVTSLNKSTLYTSSAEALIYSTVNGKIGVMCPLVEKQEIQFFIKLQSEILKKMKVEENYKLQKTRYGSIKNIIDGQIIQLFDSLSIQQQNNIAKQLNKSIGDVLQGILAIKHKYV